MFVLAGCFQPIDEELLLVVADRFPPQLEITSPSINEIYVSTMAIVGTVFDSTREDDDRNGKLASITLSFLEKSQYNRSVYFEDDGVTFTEDPVLDESFFSYDPETGEFALWFNTIGLQGDQYLTVTVVDRNANEVSRQITLRDPEVGPRITILEPLPFSEYQSTVRNCAIISVSTHFLSRGLIV
jgi:hypothetical protein